MRNPKKVWANFGLIAFIIVGSLVAVSCSSITDSIMDKTIGSLYKSYAPDTQKLQDDARNLTAEMTDQTAAAITMQQYANLSSIPMDATMQRFGMQSSTGFLAQTDSPSMTPAERRAREELLEKARIELKDDIETIPVFTPSQAADQKKRVLDLVASRYEEAIKAIEVDSIFEFNRLIDWPVSFDGSVRNSDKASEYSLIVSVAINHFDRPNFVEALAAAVFSLDPDSSVAAGNLASAIVTAGERRYPYPGMESQLVPYRKDAYLLYEYAIACSVDRSGPVHIWTLRSLVPLTNFGNLLVDMKEYLQAKSILLSARKLDPTNWEAALALASCYEAMGRPDLAKAVMEDEALYRPAIIQARKKIEEQQAKTDQYVGLPLNTSEAVFEEALSVMRSQEILTSADFIAGLDQSERNRMRYFIENLPVQGSYKAPSISTVAQYASLRSISEPLGRAALNDFTESVAIYTVQAQISEIGHTEQLMSSMGMKVSYNFNMEDALANPKKYEDFDFAVEIDDSNMDALIDEMEKKAKQAERDLAVGKTSSAIELGAMIDPSIAVFLIDPNTYADPMNIVIQQYNMAVFNRKINTYGSYLWKINASTRSNVEDIIRSAGIKYAAVQTRQEKAQSSSKAPSSAAEALKAHAEHVKFANELNQITTVAYSQATSVASVAYLQKIKPQVEALYYDVIRHVALISDPEVRRQKEILLRYTIDASISTALQAVLSAYSAFEYIDEWDCGCDVGSIRAQYDEEEKAKIKAENERIQRNMNEKKRFDSGTIPESSPLFKRLDAYGTNLDIPFIPFMTGRISCARTVVNFSADLSSLGGPKLDYAFNENAFTGATTHRGGMEIGFGADKAGMSAGAKISLGGSMSFNGDGVVTDYSATGSAKVSVSAGGLSVSAGGEVSVGPQGVTQYDVGVAAEGGISRAYGSGTVKMESTVQRGNSLSAKVEANLNPMSGQVDPAINTALGPIGAAFPVDTSIKKELWDGRFSF